MGRHYHKRAVVGCLEGLLFYALSRKCYLWGNYSHQWFPTGIQWGGTSNSFCHDKIIMKVDSSFSLLIFLPIFLPNKFLSLFNLNFFSTGIFRNLTGEKYYNSWIFWIRTLLIMAGKITYFRLSLQRIYSILQRISSIIFITYLCITQCWNGKWCVCVYVCVHALTLYPGNFHFSTAHHWLLMLTWTLAYIRLPGNQRTWNLMQLDSLNSNFRFTNQGFFPFLWIIQG